MGMGCGLMGRALLLQAVTIAPFAAKSSDFLLCVHCWPYAAATWLAYTTALDASVVRERYLQVQQSTL